MDLAVPLALSNPNLSRFRAMNEAYRRRLQEEANHVEDKDIIGPTWDTTRLQEEFTIEGFLAPFVVVTRKADNVRGSLMFRHNPRIYFGWTPNE